MEYDEPKGEERTVTFVDNHDDTTTVEIALREVSFACASLHRGTPERFTTEPVFKLNDVVDSTSSTQIAIPREKLLAEEYVLVIKDGAGRAAYAHHPTRNAQQR